MFNIKALRQQKADALAKAEGISQAAEKENRNLTDAERAEFDAAMASVTTLNADISRVEKLMDEQRTAPAAGTAARAALPNAADKPFESLGEQLVAVVQASRPGGHTDPRLLKLNAAASGASEGVPADGGFLVQQDFSSVLLDKSYETGILSRDVTRLPLSANSNSIKLKAVDDNSRATGSRWGGVQVYWAAEADTVTAKKPKFRDMELKLNKLMGICYATDELLEDAVALGATISKAFPEEFGFVIDDAIWRGTGIGQPLGFTAGGAYISVAKGAAQAADTVIAQNVTDMWARMPARLISGAKWYINQEVLGQLPLMVVGQQPVFLPPNGLQPEFPYGTLLGRPVVVVEQAEKLGDVGDIVFANLGQYVMIDKGGLKSDVSMHVRFLYGEQTFRWTYRVDGQPAWNDGLTMYKGTNKLSPFVAVADRA